MKTFSDIISEWPSCEAFSREIGLKRLDHGKAMRRRNSIPKTYWPAVIAAAKRRGVDGVTMTALERAAADRLLSGAPVRTPAPMHTHEAGQ